MVGMGLRPARDHVMARPEGCLPDSHCHAKCSAIGSLSMPSSAVPTPAEARALARLRALASAALVLGGGISAGMMIRAGLRQHSSLFLIVLIDGWVVAPFAVLGLAHTFAGRWPAQARATLAVLSLVVAIGSPLIYVVD